MPRAKQPKRATKCANPVVRKKRAPLKKVPAPLVIDPNQRYSLFEVHAALRQSHVKTFDDIRKGRIAVIKDGARTYVLGSELIRRSASPCPAPLSAKRRGRPRSAAASAL